MTRGGIYYAVKPNHVLLRSQIDKELEKKTAEKSFLISENTHIAAAYCPPSRPQRHCFSRRRGIFNKIPVK